VKTAPDPITLAPGRPTDVEKTYESTVSSPTGKTFVRLYKDYLRSRVGDAQYDLVADKEERLIAYGESVGTGYFRQEDDIAFTGPYASFLGGVGGYVSELLKPSGAKPTDLLSVVSDNMRRSWGVYAKQRVAVLKDRLAKELRAQAGTIHLGVVAPILALTSWDNEAGDPRNPATCYSAPHFAACEAGGPTAGSDGMIFDHLPWVRTPWPEPVRGPGVGSAFAYRKTDDGQVVWVSQGYCLLLVDLWAIDKEDNLSRKFVVMEDELPDNQPPVLTLAQDKVLKMCADLGIKAE
jgi:hypothetical protein